MTWMEFNNFRGLQKVVPLAIFYFIHCGRFIDLFNLVAFHLSRMVDVESTDFRKCLWIFDQNLKQKLTNDNVISDKTLWNMYHDRWYL